MAIVFKLEFKVTGCADPATGERDFAVTKYRRSCKEASAEFEVFVDALMEAQDLCGPDVVARVLVSLIEVDQINKD